MSLYISKTNLIEKMSQVADYREVVEQVEAAVQALGWEDRWVFDGREVMQIGTTIAEQTQQRLAASANPVERADAARIAPLVKGLRDDVLPMIPLVGAGVDE